MHNTLPIRGALVRDAKNWANSLNQAIKLFGSKSDILIMQHGYPVFGQKNLINFLEDHRDMMKFMHDQT